MNADKSWLSNPEIFAVNRISAYSDHVYYERLDEARKSSNMSLRQYLNGTWKFQYNQNPEERQKNFYQLDYDCSSWGAIQVPGHIQLQGYGQPQYTDSAYPWDGYEEVSPPNVPRENNPVGSYMKKFDLDQSMLNNSVYISFQGVEIAFYVWLNGHFIGFSEDSFTPADFELTPYIRNKDNKLAVEVYQRSSASWLEDQDFWRLSGIFRDVYLYTKPSIHVNDLSVETNLFHNHTEAELVLNLSMIGDYDCFNATLLLEDREGRKVLKEKYNNIKSKTLKMSANIDNPNLWSAEIPYLYTAYILIYDKEDNLIEVVPQHVGFRQFEMKNNLMLINGKRIVFKGVNRHEFNCHSGRSISKEDMLWDIKTLKRNNINAVRTSHYPNNSYWYTLCDMYGIYVIDEMNLETHGTWYVMDEIFPDTAIPKDDKTWEPAILDRAKSMYERDKNHPSILIWSIGNESYGGEVLYNVSNYFREKDKSRLVHYEGVFNDRTFNSTSDMESQMYSKPQDVEKYLTSNPQKPFILCEYMHAMGTSLGGMKDYINLEREYQLYQGGFIWDFIDQGLIKKNNTGEDFIAYGGDFGDYPTDFNFCLNGIVYADRKETPMLQEVKYLYQNIDIYPDVNEILLVNNNLFLDTSCFILFYKVLCEGECIYSHQVKPNVSPGDSEKIKIQLPINYEENKEYVLHASLVLKEDTRWASKGFEIAFGEGVIKDRKVHLPNLNKGLSLVNGTTNIGILGKDFNVQFSRETGLLHSLVYSGREMIKTPPKPNYWRALTDNDKGMGSGFSLIPWLSASMYPKCYSVELVQNNDYSVSVITKFKLSIHAESYETISYTIFEDGTIKVHLEYSGVNTLPDMPIHSLMFKMPSDYKHLAWYGNGPLESYKDRSSGARILRYDNEVGENSSLSGVPQEAGNKTEVRWVCISDNIGHGLKLEMFKNPFECNISPYTAFEIENAEHYHELPKSFNTVITVAGEQMGVGGDDSWGAPVRDKYKIKNSSFDFLIKPLKF